MVHHNKVIEAAQSEANEPKHALMKILDKLRDQKGCGNKVSSLDAIIFRLERWQNTP